MVVSRASRFISAVSWWAAQLLGSVAELSVSCVGAIITLGPGPKATIRSHLREDLSHTHCGVECRLVWCGAGWVRLNNPRPRSRGPRKVSRVRLRLKNNLLLVAAVSLFADRVIDDDSRCRRCHGSDGTRRFRSRWGAQGWLLSRELMGNTRADTPFR